MKGKNTIVIGAAWGDEGKGKVIDWLSGIVGAVVRFNGGANAGHTLMAKDKKYVTHLLPSGIIRSNMMNIVGSGVACDLEVMRTEIALAREHGAHVILDESAPIVLPIHKCIDAGREAAAKGGALGTTKRGIGPLYADFWARRCLRLGDLRSKKQITKCLRNAGYYKELLAICQFLEVEAPGLEETIEWAAGFTDMVVPLLADTRATVHTMLILGKNVLFEGAQGVLLDTIQGTAPYTTSSICTAAGVATTFGLYSPGSVIGVSKAYTTRVGAGPFPTKLAGEVGDRLREKGGEYGTTTGRPRDCGWLDLPALRYAVRVGGITELAITKLDILSGMGDIPVCTDYREGGCRSIVSEFTTLTTQVMEDSRPMYTKLDGWEEDIQDCRRRCDLPFAAQAYLAAIEKYTGVPITMIGVGPERDQIIMP